jgi:hypothetical protein
VRPNIGIRVYAKGRPPTTTKTKFYVYGIRIPHVLWRRLYARLEPK